ncbi:MAG: TIGR03013 family PEP-CTERM/XrtA system glycosyltransferase [Deltaproteobacteria bacterium]|nr:TIGR03013 family PEP-CTERM/XrtA system glycosyltransferase [Deltaproteobacteria bacterium]
MARVFNHWFSPRKVGLFALELMALFSAALAGEGLLAGPAAMHTRAGLALAIGVTGLVQVALYAGDLYDLGVAQRDRETGTRLLRAGGLALAFVAPLLAHVLHGAPRGTALGAAAGAVFGAVAVRYALWIVLAHPSRVLIVGSGPRAQELARSIQKDGEGTCELLGFVDDGDPEGAPPNVLRGDVAEVAARLRADAVVVASGDARRGLPADALLRCRLDGRNVLEGARFAERVLRRLPVNQLRQSDLIYAEELRPSRVRAFVKRALDLISAGTLALLAAPVMLVVAAAVKLDSKGPLFYSQERVGLGGKVFQITKFRTMRVDAEAAGAQWAQKNDPRVTRVGKWLRLCRLDELPQLFSVLRGDMTLVGPRPERPVFVNQLKDVIPFYGLREAVKPGVTGWAQIRYPYGASVEDARNKLEYDLYYIKNGSAFLDITILFHTVRHVLLGRGAR